MILKRKMFKVHMLSEQPPFLWVLMKIPDSFKGILMSSPYDFIDVNQLLILGIGKIWT